MKSGKNRTARAVIALLFIALCAGFLTAGLPAAGLIASAAGAEKDSAEIQNITPIAKNLEYTTFRGVSIRGRLEAVDPDGDALTFEITDVPKKGSVEAHSDGTFVYTPNDGKKGRDAFSFVAVDTDGGISFPATVTIKINKQTTNISYSDMKDNPSCYASLLMAENGILTGEKLGSEYFFRPDSTVTRGEFLAMCMSLTDTQTLDGITRTGFYDDDSIPMWAKPYVSAALMSGIITGFKDDDGRLIFASEEPITVSEAAMILNNALRLNTVVSVSAPADADEAAPCITCGEAGCHDCPVWAGQAEANLSAVSVMKPMGTVAYQHCLTRADAADLLAASFQFLESRDGQSSLLSWAK
jgi:hypothetical protein